MATSEIALGISIVSAGIGILGAVNAHRALRWQRARDTERRMVRAHIELAHSMTNIPPVSPPDWAEPDADDVMNRGRYRLTISVVNDSEEVGIYVQRLEIRPASDRAAVPLLGMQPADQRLEPGQRLIRELDFAELKEWARYSAGFVVSARLTNGTQIEKPGELDAQIIRYMERATG